MAREVSTRARRRTSWAILGALLLACGGRSSDSQRTSPTSASGRGGRGADTAGEGATPPGGGSAGSGATPSGGGTNGEGDAAGAPNAGEPERGGVPTAGAAPIGGASSAGRPPVGGAPTAGNPNAAGMPASGGLPSWGNCVYDFVAHGPNETFLARDGCNTCVCQGENVACTETACTPDCEHHAAARLCVIGRWDGGDLMRYEVGDPLLIQVEPEGCISGWCNDVLIETCSVTLDANGADYTASADFCTHFVDRMLCDDCGAFSATCEAEALTEGTHTVRFPESPLTIDFTVPSAVPPGTLCIELGR